MKYRRLPLDVEARQFTGELTEDLEAWLGRAHGSWSPARSGNPSILTVYIAAGRSCMVAEGDWIVKEMGRGQGVYVMPDNVFNRMHEVVPPESKK